MPVRDFDRRLAVFALFCFAVVVFLCKPYETTLPANDSSTYAALAMSATGQGIVPRIPIGSEAYGGHWGPSGFNDMPFVFPYLSGWIMRALGPSAFSAKLLPCLLSIGCVMLTYWLGLLLVSPMAGLLGGLILCLTRDFYIDGLNAHLDTAMLVFILGSFIAWYRGRFLLAGVLAGLGVWFKSPVAFLLFPAVLVYHGVRRDLRWRPWVASLAVAAIVGFSIWILTGALGGWELVWDYWRRQVWGTAIGGRGGAQERDFLLFFTVLRSRFMPWTLLLLVSLYQGSRSRRWREPRYLYPGAAALILVLVISAIRFKYAHYYVPAYPFLALLAAYPLADWLKRHEAALYRGFAVATMALLAFFLATPVQTAPESFPAFRKFAAYIQSQGDCRDRVLFVNGFQPYGTFFDYKELINFYTGRIAVSAECGELEAKSADGVAWLIVSGPNLGSCVTPALRAKFPGLLAYGDQYLLSKYDLSRAGGADLTPLARELRAVRDCRPAPLGQDSYFRP